MDEHDIETVPLEFSRLAEDDMRTRARQFRELLARRRSVRHFSTEPVPLDVITSCIDTAAQAPSGANKQPWTFVVVTDPAVKRNIREAAEAEEREFYTRRASETWLRDLSPLGTDEHKPFLDDAPALIVVFAQRTGEQSERHYYVAESVGIATGFLLAALHNAGLATLTHTPSPMKFLGEILSRPKSERAFLLIPVGYPAEQCVVPAIDRKPVGEVMVSVAPKTDESEDR